MKTAKMQRYREGGWGWAVVLSAFLAEFIVTGTMKAWGVFLTSMMQDFDTDVWIIGSINSLHLGVQFVLTPLVTAIARKIGSRPVIIFGGIVYGLGLVLSTTTYDVAVLAVTLVVISGSGTACTLETTRSEMAFYFHEKYALVSFIAFAGAPLGVMFYGIAAQVLLETYGWRGAMLLLGGVGFNLTWAGLLVRRRPGDIANAPHQYLPTDDNGSNESSDLTNPQKQTCQTNKNFWNSFVSVLSLDIFLNVEFMLVAASKMFHNIAYGGNIVYMVPNGLSVGLSSYEASLLTTSYGVGSLAGLFLAGLMLHVNLLSSHGSAAIFGSVTAAALCLDPFVSSFVGQMAITFVVGAGVFSVHEVAAVLSRNLPFSDDRFISVLGWQSFLSGLATSAGDVTSGWLYDVTQSFHATYFMYGAATVVTVLCLLAHLLYRRSIERETGSPF